MRLVSFWGARSRGLGALSPEGDQVCGLLAAAEARGDEHPEPFARARPFLQAGPEAAERARELAEWAFSERPAGVVEALRDVKLR